MLGSGLTSRELEQLLIVLVLLIADLTLAKFPAVGTKSTIQEASGPRGFAKLSTNIS